MPLIFYVGGLCLTVGCYASLVFICGLQPDDAEATKPR
jgi:hypothetical protein